MSGNEQIVFSTDVASLVSMISALGIGLYLAWERLHGLRSGVNRQKEDPIPRLREAVDWEALLAHCARVHDAAEKLENERYGHLKESVDGLRTDMKEALKDLGKRIDNRNGKG